MTPWLYGPTHLLPSLKSFVFGFYLFFYFSLLCLVVEPMLPLFDSISKIYLLKEAWRLKVRVLRTWIVPSFGNHNVANSIEIVLVDEDSNKIQATVKKQLINRFKENIIEGQTYQMSYFSIFPNQGNYRAAEHEFKLVFLNRTTVIPVPNDAIPKTCFKFCPFDELLKMTEDCVYLVDIIGLLTFAGEEKEYVKDGKVMKMIVLELSSKELTIRYALFGEYVDEVHRFLGSGYMEQRVVIQLAKVKFLGVDKLVSKMLCMLLACSKCYPNLFILFFNPVLKIDTKSVGADKYFRTFRVRIVCDDATIIAMFELPNYDADAERTPVKDGYLEKIPSSDHEYIVDKKDPCEVLDEGITSDGNCSNMKTNCKPLIDFLDENGAEVPGLDDISSEKGKTVDDSVHIDRECSLEIEVLFNSPPMKTTDVLSAVLDGSPVHIVYNLPRGGKVKKNLKKAFDDVADEELGPTSKVLKNRDL
ncbi:hypothetical protein Ahy_B06g081791 [Arachis hypogaea]|uniref:Replication protein A 70 kDa DNA-binding subunit B/D first OB fold domain-containing protein n=1 Tax=Arachis hypogaea TaxID=3818 RepID=A0A444YLX9_ARAHY|nr:hypothetical protein Ahy_B06g081791 [Arachis hypogaea]